MRKIVITFLILLSLGNFCFAQENKTIDNLTNSYIEKVDDALNKIDFNEMTDIYNSEIAYPEFNSEEIIKKIVSGKTLFSFKNIFDTFTNIFFYEGKLVLKSMLIIFAISLLGIFLSNLKSSLNNEEISVCGFFLIHIIIIGILSTIFSNLSEIVISSVRNLSLFIKSIFPIVFSTLFTSGAITSSQVLQPFLTIGIQIFIEIIIKILIPFVLLSFSICIVSSLSAKINAEKFAFFLMKCVRWSLTVILIIFVCMTSIQSVVSSSFDGLSVKLTKYATTNLIPFVGGVLSETVETVLSCSILIKNAVGIFGILAVIYISILPIIKIWLNLMLLRFSASVMQPVCDDRIIKCMSNTGDLISLLLAIISTTAVMFILIITILINLGSSVFMLSK